MAAISTFSDVGQRLVKLFKLDGRSVIEAHIHLVRDEVITMDVLKYVEIDGEVLTELEPIMKHYELREIEDV